MFYLTSQNMIHCYWSARKLGRRLENKHATWAPPPFSVSDLTLPPKSWLIHGSGTRWTALFPPKLAFCTSFVHTGWNWIPKSSNLGDAFTSSWCSSGTEGSVTDTHVHYFLFDLILDEPEVGYDFNKKQCQRGEEGFVEMHEEISSPQDVREISHGSSEIGSNSVHLSN